MLALPRELSRPEAPPLKCQGIKTRLLPFIAASLRWDGAGRWVEPFLGSGAVALNLAPERALLGDTNPHLIRFYEDLRTGALGAEEVRGELTRLGERLRREGERVYYELREAFNAEGGSLRYLFLSRACFNGLVRFNRAGGFNVPFCRKPERFRPALVTRITNQVRWAAERLRSRDWELRCAPALTLLGELEAGDFCYLDPPYIGRHACYYNAFTEADGDALARAVWALPCGWALSMWRRNRFRENAWLRARFAEAELVTTAHFYHLGAREDQRHAMEEALAIKPGCAERPAGAPSA